MITFGVILLFLTTSLSPTSEVGEYRGLVFSHDTMEACLAHRQDMIKAARNPRKSTLN